MTPSTKNWLIALALVAVGFGIAAGAVYVGDTDDAPGASLAGIVIGFAMALLAVRIARRKT
jgi:peptidoglycan/LPS O-acetylase OafA/YrhL